MSTQLRETWLTKFSDGVGAKIASINEADEGAAIRISCGFAPADGRRKSASAVLLPPACSDDESVEVFVSPVLSESYSVGAAVLPLLVQAWIGDWGSNRAATREVLRRLNCSADGSIMAGWAKDLISGLGAYPHAAVTVPVRVSGGTRLLKYACAHGFKFVVRIAAGPVREFGAPLCPCHQVGMVQA
jgi:hypothetical protein